MSSIIEKLDIIHHLEDVEHDYNVKILLAVESGSRAWGFESRNSDWDVRFIYVHKPEWYMSIEPQRDVIEHIYDDDVDLVGWELRKALNMLKRSNPSLLEWLNSPIVYYQNDMFVERIRKVESAYIKPISLMYHYHHIFTKHDERYLQKEGYPMKRFLYYLRSVLACKWIERNQTLPPVRFTELVESTVDDGQIRTLIARLVEIKKSGVEKDMLAVDDALVNYARRLADSYNDRIAYFRPEQKTTSAKALDSILYNMVQQNK